MAMLNKFTLTTALCVLISFSPLSFADEIQDANKLFKQGQHAQALEKVNSVLASKPKDAQARFLKGLIVNDQGNATEAIKIFSALTEDYPELPEPYNNLAVLYASQGQFEKAKVALELAIRTHPSYATAHENLGDIYAKMASQAYDRALQLDKSNTGTQTKLALIRDLFVKTPRATKPASVVTALAPTATPPVTTPTISAMSNPVVESVVVAQESKSLTKSEPASETNTEVLNVTRDWAAAWSAKNSGKYLSFYAANFNTPDGLARSAWEDQRKERIAKPKSIEVKVQDAKVKIQDARHANVTFKQSYRASHLKTTSNKTLVWVKNGTQWQIVEERSTK